MAEDTPILDEQIYSSTIDGYLRRNDMPAIEHYCNTVKKQLWPLVRDGKDPDNNARLLIRVYSDLRLAYIMLNKPEKAVQAAEDALRIARRVLKDPRDICSYD